MTFDLPAGDLRRALDALGPPDAQLGSAMRWMLETYMNVHPLAGDELDVYFIDAQFPHNFYENAEAAFLHWRFDVVGLDEATERDLDRAEAAEHTARTFREAGKLEA